MSDQSKVLLYMVMSQNVILYLGDGDFIMFDKIPISTIKLHEEWPQTFPDISLFGILDESRAAPRRLKPKRYYKL